MAVRPDANQIPDRPERGWERPVVKPKGFHHARSTYHVDAPSPGQEILAKYEAELNEQADPAERSDQVICF